jgi:uncharacterized protein
MVGIRILAVNSEVVIRVSIDYTRGEKMKFEWDYAKEQKNIQKHGLDFQSAICVFQDNLRLEYYDEAHSLAEDRYVTIGLINDAVLVVTVVYTERHDVIRIISARKATRQERSLYYDNLQGN